MPPPSLLRAKFAVTESAPFRTMLHVALPVHAPDHELNTSFDPAVAVSVRFVFSGKLALHVAGQLIPCGALVTVPEPDPLIVTVNISPIVNAALTDSALAIVIAHAPLPEQAPLHPPKK